jgi:ATP-binding cassette, subfamily B, multidrug efflux pump
MISKLKFLLKYTHKFRWWYTGGIIFLGLTTWASVLIPEYLQKSIDLIPFGKTQSESQFYYFVKIILVLAVALIFVRTLSRVLFFIPARLIERKLKGDMFQKLTSFGKDYYDNNESGASISKINNDINGVRMITGFGILQTFNILFSLSITPYKMWQLSWELTLYCAIPLVIIFTIVRTGMSIMVKNTHLRMASLQKLSARTVSFLSGVSVIKSFNMHKWAEKKIHEENENLKDYSLRIAWIRAFVLPLLFNLEQIFKIIILLIGGIYVINKQFTIGELTAFIAYSSLLAMPITAFGWVLTVFQQGFVGITSIQTIMGRSGVDDEKKELPKPEKLKLFNEGVEIKNLTFTYLGSDVPILKNISFEIKPGEVIGVTGEVGSGKTTLVNCINRYLDIDEGQIFFNSRDAAILKGSEVRSVVRTVSQDVFLFSDTIENNIRFGAGENEREEPVDKVIYQSSLAEELKRFDDKEKTLVGEKGIMLSGGQKQRISLARALYTPCDLLILDDVFSAVDTETERFLIRQIFENHSAKSLLIVSNRTSVLQKTDKILVLENGKMVAQGTHNELLKTSEFYRKTFELQEE